LNVFSTWFGHTRCEHSITPSDGNVQSTSMCLKQATYRRSCSAWSYDYVTQQTGRNSSNWRYVVALAAVLWKTESARAGATPLHQL